MHGIFRTHQLHTLPAIVLENFSGSTSHMVCESETFKTLVTRE
jgi:hypothetical protein